MELSPIRTERATQAAPAPGPLRLRRAASAADVEAALALRHAAFFPGAGEGLDADPFDARWQHLLIEGPQGLQGTFRYHLHPDAHALGAGYAAHSYDLARLPGQNRWPVLEIGRVCAAPGAAPEGMRLALAAMARLALGSGAGALLGCVSFAGLDWMDHAEAFADLAAHHLLPLPRRPARRAAEIFPFAQMLGPGRTPCPRAARRATPPLLRSYLAMGARVSDHAVIDRALGTLHVLAWLDVAAIPPARARALRDLAAKDALQPLDA